MSMVILFKYLLYESLTLLYFIVANEFFFGKKVANELLRDKNVINYQKKKYDN